MTFVQRASGAVRATGHWSTSTTRHIWHFFLAPLVDHYRGISAVRLVIIVGLIWVTHETVIHERPLNWIHFWIFVACLAAAFGMKAFMAFLDRAPKAP